MFTGIIESMAKILQKTDSGLILERPKMFDDIKIGCSIAVSGACLSVIAFDAVSMSFDVVPTTFQKTKLGLLNVGDSVNLERAMKADGRFEGHIVTGHCEGVGIVVAVTQTAPTPGPSPWPSIAYANVGQQGEGSSVLSNFSQLRKRVWKGTSDSKRSPHVIVEHAREMRRDPTDAEKKLWEQLRGNKIDDIRFRRQHPIGNYIVDFYADALKLAIEVDGGIHNDPGLKEHENHRTEDLNSRGISVMRFSNQDIHDRLKEVLLAIHSFNRAPLARPAEGERSESEVPGEGSGVGANATGQEIMSKSKTAGLESSLPVVNLEKSGVGAQEVKKRGEALRERGSLLSVCVPASLLPFIVPHGSITFDGVALTVADLKDDQITVALIPHTLSLTTLGLLKTGGHVNIETDILGKYILKAHGHR